MTKKPVRSTEHMIDRARQLRRSSSFPERLLWGRLRDGRCGGLKFRRQHPLGPYVVDFFCESAGVAIELDGRSHDEGVDYDHSRQRFIEQLGLRVLRVTTDQLLQNLNDTVEAIAVACLPSVAPPSPGPAGRLLPEGEG